MIPGGFGEGLNEVTIPRRPSSFCDNARAKKITAELLESQAELPVLLGDIPIVQYLRRAADMPCSTLQEYCGLCGNGKTMGVPPLTHPRQIGAGRA